MTQSMPVMAEDQAEWELEQLVKSGVFPDRRAALRSALRALYLRQPETRLRMVLRAYETGEISLGRAAEVMGVSPEEMKDILREAGGTIQLGSIDAAELLEDSRHA